MWTIHLGKMIDVWGRIGAAILGAIVLAHSVGWLLREITLWLDFRVPGATK